jgi:hypothetical protein
MDCERFGRFVFFESPADFFRTLEARIFLHGQVSGEEAFVFDVLAVAAATLPRRRHD